MGLRSRHDGEILRLAVPALGALAAEPLYVLVDTAIVGHLGRPQLAALGVAATVLTVVTMFNFLQYGTTAQVARASGAGKSETARRLGAQALWLSLALGSLVAIVVAALAVPIVDAVGAEGEAAAYAVTYLRIVAIGIPSAFIALGAQGFLRGVGDLRTPLVIVVAANVANAILEVVLVYGLDLGVRGSAWGTALAQTGMGIAFVTVVLARVGSGRIGLAPLLARRLLSIGRYLFVRTGSLVAFFLLAGVVAARDGDATVAAYQICFQIWILLALVLDAIAIAGQIIVGRELGAGRVVEAVGASSRMIALAVAGGAVFTICLLALEDVLPRVFTSDAAVLAEAHSVWWIVALMQPLAGAVFALDGVLIGASDGPFVARSAAAAFLAGGSVLLATLVSGWGGVGVWSAFALLIGVRLTLMSARFRRRRWLVVGWAA